MGKLIVSADNGKYFIGDRPSGRRGGPSEITVEYLPCTADTHDILNGDAAAGIKMIDLGLFSSEADAWDAIHHHQNTHNAAGVKQ